VSAAPPTGAIGESDAAPEIVVTADDDGVAVVTFNRPARLNALSGAGMAALAAAYARLDADPAVRAVILTGAGRAFCSGADLSRRGGAFQAPADVATFRSSPPRPLAFQIRKPVIAAINGHAVGLGMTLALHCDLRLMASEARWGVVQVRRGVVPDAVAHWTLVRSVGTARAAEILLTGRLFDGPEAVALGVANRCLPAAEVLPAARALARELATEVSPLSAGLCKRMLWAAADGDVDDIDRLESEAHRWLMGAPDALEGGRAALEKRPPRWRSSVRDWPSEGPFASGWPPPAP